MKNLAILLVLLAAPSLAASRPSVQAADIDALLAKIDPAVVQHAEARFRARLDGEAAKQFHGALFAGEYGKTRHPYVKILRDGTWHLFMKYGIQANKAAEFLMAYDWLKSMEKPEGWAYAYLPDGTEVFCTGYKTYRYDQPESWPDGKNPAPYSRDKVQLGAVPPLLQIDKEGGREALRRHFSGPATYSPQQYLEARLAAAKAAATPQHFTSRKAEFAHAFPYLANVRLARGQLSPETAAPGGYGVLSMEPGWTWQNRVCQVADWFDLQLGD